RVAGGAVLPDLGLELSEIDVAARSDGDEVLDVSGSLRSGGGELGISGTLPLPPTAENPAEIRLTGERVLAMNTPDTRMWVSMDLTTRVDDAEVAVSGRVEVPEATLQVASGPTAVPVSADAVVVGGEGAAPSTGPRLVADVAVELGDAVAVAGEGFGGRLNGQLGVRARPDGSLIGTGELLIRQGNYSAYGQNLAIEGGRVSFTSSPIDDPGLNIRAFRQAQDNVTAGLHIQGTLRQPIVELYSNPAMPQMDALSYLLFGRRTRGEENPDLASTAALSLGLASSRAVLGRLGLDLVTIDPGKSVDDAALMLGTYIGPDLFVSYGVGLFRSLHILRLRYDIDRNWSLQAEQSQEETAGDILYSIER
ncbi:MAG: translocation/assembly module TamB domain-containing protein, partial [Acidobacteriota bacterium]